MRKYAGLFYFFFLTVFCSVFSYSQKIENVQFKQEEDKIVITYDLISDDDSKNFEIIIEMSKNGGINFTTTPKTLLGDVGKNIQPGKSKKISWDVLKDVAELRGNDFVFKVIANAEGAVPEISKSSSGGGIPTWVWIGGGAVVVGGAAAILLSGKKDDPVTPDLPDNSQIKWPPR